MPDAEALLEEIGPNQYRVTIQVNYWDKANRLAFDRAECWEQKPDEDTGREYGACVFSIVSDIRPTLLPEPDAALGVSLVALAALARWRKS